MRCLLPVNGERGKTHFYDKVLKPEVIEQTLTKTKDGKQENYKSIKISLFGLETLTDLHFRVFTLTYSFIDKKIWKKFEKWSNQALAFFGKSDIANAIKNVGELTNNYSKIVLCLDDLERKSEKLELTDIIGFVSSVVDEGYKVIIIGNEGKIKSDDYKKIKEKVIGQTLVYKLNLDEAFPNIIEKYLESDDIEYYNFLVENKKMVVDIFKAGKSENLRTLIFALEMFKSIHTIYLKEKQANDNVNEGFWNAKLLSLLESLLAISVEYKKGKFTHKDEVNLKSLDRTEINSRKAFGNELNPFPSDENDGQAANARQESENEKFLNEYFDKYLKDKSNALVYQNLFDFITGLSPFIKEDTDKELNEIFGEVDYTKEKYLFNEMINNQLVYLDDDEYVNIFYGIIEYVKELKYEYLDIWSIWAFIYSQQKILKIDIDIVFAEFKEAIVAISKSKKPAPESLLEMQMNTRHVDDENRKVSLEELKSFVIETNKAALKTQEKENAEKYFKELNDNAENAHLRVEEWKEIGVQPIFEYFEATDIKSFIESLSNKAIISMNDFIKIYYLSHENDDLVKIEPIVQDVINEKDVTLSKKLLEILLKTIGEYKERLKPTQL
jgi:hypothetical protein